MKRFLLDTGIAGDYINRRRGVFDRARKEAASGNRIGISIIVLAELYYGIERSVSREKNLQRLTAALSNLTIWPLTESGTARYGSLAAELRRTGRLIPTADMLTAAIALTLGNCTVVSKDTDFAAVPGLDVENWAE
jgi:tRNA(fMet)-specific endonuclease VapC